jgi:hypothetical protein
MKEDVFVGTVTSVEFLANAKGGRPICRVGNIVGFIDSTFDKFVAPRSVWIVEVQNVNEKTAIVLPIVKIKSAWENLRDIEKKINVFKKEKPERKKKPHVKYTNI